MDTSQAGENRQDILSAARSRLPAPQYHPVLVTEVTQMRTEHFCVAAYDLHARRMVRPLRTNGENWIFDEFQEAYYPGQLLDANGWAARADGRHPHCREDIILKSGMVELEVWPEPDVYAAMLPSACCCIAQLFDCRPLENSYIEEGTECRSLGGVQAARRSVKFLVNSRHRLRLQLEDSDDELYNLPVTCNRLRTLFATDYGPSGLGNLNRWLEEISPDEPIILRVGLGRGYAGGELNYTPRRCYVQINGLLTSRAFPSMDLQP